MDRHFLLPGYALHEKDLQRQVGDSTLISSQERRALAVPGDKPLVNRWLCSPIRLHREFLLFVLLGNRSGQLSTMHWGREGRLSPGRADPSASHIARPSPACAAPTQPARGMSVRVLDSTNICNLFSCKTRKQIHLINKYQSNQKSEHTTGSMKRAAPSWGEARRGAMGRDSGGSMRQGNNFYS